MKILLSALIFVCMVAAIVAIGVWAYKYLQTAHAEKAVLKAKETEILARAKYLQEQALNESMKSL